VPSHRASTFREHTGSYRGKLRNVTTSDRSLRDLVSGTRVEVRSRFDGSWAAGFELAEPSDGRGWHVRRLSDGSVLPTPFPHEEVRPERTS
jgi:hypothetical protein